MTKLAPSRTLLTAALSGLVATACGGGGMGDPDPELPDARPIIDGRRVDAPAPVVDAGPPDAVPTKIISEVEGNRTFANINADCDARGGYTQIHAGCGHVNTCAGFSYGDWDPGVTTEHSCAAVNGCNGISCVVLPEDTGKTGQQVYEEFAADDMAEGERAPCSWCHMEWDDTGPLLNTFKLQVPPGDPRTLDNWLTRSAAEQARVVAFGVQGTRAAGHAFNVMAPYYKRYSRAEIERAVEYLRTSPTLTRIRNEYKESDPAVPRIVRAVHRRHNPR